MRSLSASMILLLSSLAACLALLIQATNQQQLKQQQLAAVAKCKADTSTKRMICYFPTWAMNRNSINDFDPCLCTHVLYSFVGISNYSLTLSPSDQDKKLFQMMKEAWKEKSPNLKILMSVGGATTDEDEESTIIDQFDQLVVDDDSRRKFCQSVIDVARKYSLDGIDIDWEFPKDYQRDQYTQTIKKCHEMFTRESQTSGKPKLLLSAATDPDPDRMGSYDLPELNKYFDFMNLMTYDIHGSWDGNYAHHSPLFGPDGAATFIDNYINAGFSPEKLNLGLAAYGRSTGPAGPYTNGTETLAYFEICQLKCQNVWIETYDSSIKGSKSTGPNAYVFHDSIRSMIEKTEWLKSKGIGGAFIWEVSFDDPKGTFCCQGKYPLISTVLNTLTNSPTMDPNTSCCFNRTHHSTSSRTTTTTTTTSCNSASKSRISIEILLILTITSIITLFNSNLLFFQQ